MIYLHKILPLLVSPFAISLFLILIGIWLRRRRYGVMAVFILVISALPITGNILTYYLEKDQTYITVEDAPTADAIVVLSGMSFRSKRNDDVLIEFNSAVDRYFAGLDLMAAEKAPLLIFTRGILPWEHGIPEGEFLAAKAIADGIAESQILLTEPAENTAAEAHAIKQMMLMEDAHIILVTSAFHMPRASRLFSAKGIKVSPYPVDFRSSYHNTTMMDFLPNANALNNTSSAIREMIGRAWYALRY